MLFPPSAYGNNNNNNNNTDSTGTTFRLREGHVEGGDTEDSVHADRFPGFQYDEDRYDSDDDDDDDDDDENDDGFEVMDRHDRALATASATTAIQELKEEIQELKTTLEENMTKQDRVLQTFSQQTSQDYTNQSMALLRNETNSTGKADPANKLSSTTTEDAIVSLHAIRASLQAKEGSGHDENNGDKDNSEKELLKETLSRLDLVLKRLTTGDNTAPTSIVPPLNNGSGVPMENGGDKGEDDAVQLAIQKLLGENQDIPIESFLSGIQMLHLYMLNLSNHSHVPKYRKIYTSNDRYQKTVKPLSGAEDLFRAVGFEPNGNHWAWKVDLKDKEGLNKAKAKLTEAVEALAMLKSEEKCRERELSRGAASMKDDADTAAAAATADKPKTATVATE